MTPEQAVGIVDAKVAEMQAENPNLCAMSVDQDSVNKVPFGYTEKVSYDCTLTDPLYGIPKSTDTVFITFYNKVIGMPGKVVQKGI